jgi:hypothetical protein
MAKMSFDLDTDFVQSSVKAKVRPAIEAALANIDIQEMIETTLKKPPKSDDRLSMHYALMGYAPPSVGSLLEELVKDSITEVAKEFVRRAIRNQREGIEDALLKMLTASNNKLVKSFAGAIERAFEEDWSFKLDVAVTHATTEADDD